MGNSPEQNAEFVCQMESVLDVYKRPYDPGNPVVCLDESPKQLVSETRKPIVASDGRTLYDYEYKREGAAEVYMCFEPLAGKRYIVSLRKQSIFSICALNLSYFWAKKVLFSVFSEGFLANDYLLGNFCRK